MANIAEYVVIPARRIVGLGEKLLVGVTPDIAARMPQGSRAGSVFTINCNHPAFIYGHLSLYPQRLWTLQGKDPGDAAPPAHWGELFKAGAECKDDPTGAIYPKLDEIVARYRTAYEAALAMIPTLSEDFLEREHPDAKIREVFPKLGNLVPFLFLAHPAMHFGQVSTWRRCWGMPPA